MWHDLVLGGMVLYCTIQYTEYESHFWHQLSHDGNYRRGLNCYLDLLNILCDNYKSINAY